jgi:cbb3-type cytochrome oxidase maturation protein
MEVIVILLPIALALGILFIAAFLWAAKHGQYDDLETPKFRILIDDTFSKIKTNKKKEEQ